MVKHTPLDEERIAAAVRAAEAGTSAELVCVLARASSAYEFYPLVWAALAALAAPWPMILLTRWSVVTIFGFQLALFVAVLAVLSWSALRMRLVPRAIQRKRAHRAATEQFLLRGLHRKGDRTGVLIFVSEAEHYARIIADEGVVRLVRTERWSEAVGLLVAHARGGVSRRATSRRWRPAARCWPNTCRPSPARPTNSATASTLCEKPAQCSSPA